jgi:PHP family Zn ribbon phosphoesterase
VDPETPFDALEISAATSLKQARLQYPELAGYAFITSSDAHMIGDIGRGTTTMILQEATINELRLAFANRDGRHIVEKDI